MVANVLKKTLAMFDEQLKKLTWLSLWDKLTLLTVSTLEYGLP